MLSPGLSFPRESHNYTNLERPTTHCLTLNHPPSAARVVRIGNGPPQPPVGKKVDLVLQGTSTTTAQQALAPGDVVPGGDPRVFQAGCVVDDGGRWCLQQGAGPVVVHHRRDPAGKHGRVSHLSPGQTPTPPTTSHDDWAGTPIRQRIRPLPVSGRSVSAQFVARRGELHRLVHDHLVRIEQPADRAAVLGHDDGRPP